MKIIYQGIKSGKEFSRPFKETWEVEYRIFRVTYKDRFGIQYTHIGIPLKSSVTLKEAIKNNIHEVA